VECDSLPACLYRRTQGGTGVGRGFRRVRRGAGIGAHTRLGEIVRPRPTARLGGARLRRISLVMTRLTCCDRRSSGRVLVPCASRFDCATGSLSARGKFFVGQLVEVGLCLPHVALADAAED